MFNAIMGNAGSVNSGKESFHHSGYPELGILAGSAIVGAQIPQAVGVGWALKAKRTDNVAVCFFGTGRRAGTTPFADANQAFTKRGNSRIVGTFSGCTNALCRVYTRIGDKRSIN